MAHTASDSHPALEAKLEFYRYWEEVCAEYGIDAARKADFMERMDNTDFAIVTEPTSTPYGSNTIL